MSLINLDYVRKARGIGRTARTVLDNVSLEIAERSFTTIFEPSGSGKTDLMEVIAGLTDVDDGNVVVGDVDVTRADEATKQRLLAERVGVLYPRDNLMPALTIGENFDLPSELTKRPIDADDRARIARLFQIDQILNYYPDSIARVDQQRVALAARVLAGRTILLCDEPTSGLDKAEADAILALLRMCVRELGLTVVTFSGNPLAAEYADRVFLLSNARIEAELVTPTLDSIFTALQAVHGEVSAG